MFKRTSIKINTAVRTFWIWLLIDYVKYLIGFLGRLLEILHTYFILSCTQRCFLQRNTGRLFPSQKAFICLFKTGFKHAFVYLFIYFYQWCYSTCWTTFVRLAWIFKFLKILLVTSVFFESSDQYCITFVHNWLNMAGSYFSSLICLFLISIKICKSIFFSCSNQNNLCSKIHYSVSA